MTKSEAIQALTNASEDAEWDADEVREIFHALYERYPDTEEYGDVLSLCYAAI